MKESLRVIHINTQDRGGGAEDSAYRLFCEQRRAGYIVKLIVGRKLGDDPDVIEIPITNYRRQSIISWAMVALFSPILILYGKIRGINFIWKWIRRISQPEALFAWWKGAEDFCFPGTYKILELLPWKPDVIHCHNLHGDYFDIRILPELSHKVPVILNLRDGWLLTGHCALPVNCDRFKNGCGNCPDLNIYPSVRKDNTIANWKLKRDILAQSKIYITTISKWLMNQAYDSGLSGSIERVIYNSIDLTSFFPGVKCDARRRLGLAENATIILMPGHNPFKDTELMYTVLRDIKHKQPLVFVRLGRAKLVMPLGHGILMQYPFTHDKNRLRDFYQAADIYLHVAKGEAFGKMIVEALACDCFVIATATGGIPEIFNAGSRGILVENNDPDAIRSAILQGLDMRDLIENDAKYLKDRFDVRRQINDFEKFYNECMSHFHNKISSNSSTI